MPIQPLKVEDEQTKESLGLGSLINNSLGVINEGHPWLSLRVRCEKGNEELSSGLDGAPEPNDDGLPWTTCISS